jgi:hypothetical protein
MFNKVNIHRRKEQEVEQSVTVENGGQSITPDVVSKDREDPKEIFNETQVLDYHDFEQDKAIQNMFQVT